MQEIKEELKLVLKGRTWDAIIPPIVFTALLNVSTLLVAALFALVSAALLTVRRVFNKQPIGYAAAGFLSVLLATLFSLYRQQAGDFFLPGFITSGIFNLFLLLSVFVKRPFAALASHISRGWPLDWFWRSDIRPAYSEVTLFWFFFFSLFKRSTIVTRLMERCVECAGDCDCVNFFLCLWHGPFKTFRRSRRG